MIKIDLNNYFGDFMKKKIMLVLIGLCITATAGFVCAEEINIAHGIFNVPEGFTNDTTITEEDVFLFISPDIRENSIGRPEMAAFSKGDDVFIVMCYQANNLNFELTQYPSDTPATIGEYDGYIDTDTVKGHNNATAFKYVYHSKIYIIIAPDQSMIEDAIKQ